MNSTDLTALAAKCRELADELDAAAERNAPAEVPNDLAASLTAAAAAAVESAPQTGAFAANRRAEQAPDSPVRSGTGRIRNLKQMGDAKFDALREEMPAYSTIDPEGWDAFTFECDRRAGL